MFLDRLFNRGKESRSSTPPAIPPPTISEGTDGFPVRSDSPRLSPHKCINEFYAKVPFRLADYPYRKGQDDITREILAKPGEDLVALVLALVERMMWLVTPEARGLRDQSENYVALKALLRWILRRPLPFTPQQVDLLLEQFNVNTATIPNYYPVEFVLDICERVHKSDGLLPRSLDQLQSIAASLISQGANSEFRKWRRRIEKLVGRGAIFQLAPGEAWSDAALADLASMPEEMRVEWTALLSQCSSANVAAPSSAWSKSAATALERIGFQEFKNRAVRWFALVDQPRTQHEAQFHEDFIMVTHADVLRGLAWCCSVFEDHQLAQTLGRLAISAYRKVPGFGPRAAKVGNAAITALGIMPGQEGIHQLSLVKLRLKSRPAQAAIEKALTGAAERAGLPVDEIEEMIVPTYGLTEVGRCTEVMGEFTAQLTVAGGGTELVWLKPDGKVQKSIPASVKAEHADELKELQGAAKDIQRMLPAQRERIDTLFLQQKSWPLAVWRERYLDHPLVGVIARRLLWEFTTGQETTTGIWFDSSSSRRRESAEGASAGDSPVAGQDRGLTSAATGALVDLDLRPIAHLGAETTVRLWHPISKDTEEVLAWRAWLDEQQIQQPFKQAHRELYLLTDAERQTRTYSNRYATHVLRQHQFNALCAARGWKNKLRLLVDAEFPPATLYLPKWNLRAEFWIEGAGDNYGTDTNETGTFLYLTTDQVRFYRYVAADVSRRSLGQAQAESADSRPRLQEDEPAEPLPLDEIPPLVFSEVMRDVDLFVGVASVGNDPNWADGGPEGRYQAYWQSYSFGDLSATAKTRREVLARLLPRLKIAAQCSLADKFLVVKGSLRTYKIHLGSGNILMEPNDQYLCIVPAQSAEAGKDRVFLPFEGDTTLSVILSKAFLLAEDAKIKDPTILSQINRV